MASTEVADVASQLLRVVHERGPLAYEQLSAELGRDPDDPAWDDECYDVVDGLGRIVELADERLVDKVALLAGTTLTRRLTAAEVAGGYLELGADLQAHTDLVEDSVPLAPGGRAAVELGKLPGRAKTERLVGPAGWLGDAAAGDLVGLRLTDGLLHVEVRPSVGEAGRAGEAFAGAVRARLETSEFDPPRTGVTDALWQALVDVPEAFRGAVPPLSELAAGEGLELTETMVLDAGAGAAGFPATTDLIHEAIAQEYYDADEAELVALRLVRTAARRLELCRELGEGVPDDDLAEAGEALAEPPVLDVFLAETGDDPAAGLLGAAAAPVTAGPAHAAACLLRARGAQADGDAPVVRLPAAQRPLRGHRRLLARPRRLRPAGPARRGGARAGASVGRRRHPRAAGRRRGALRDARGRGQPALRRRPAGGVGHRPTARRRRLRAPRGVAHAGQRGRRGVVARGAWPAGLRRGRLPPAPRRAARQLGAPA